MQKISHSHTHSHAHAHHPAQHRPLASFSLLRLSVVQRLTLSLIPTAVIWALLIWAVAE
jgi:hypothetical protein